MKKRMKGKRNSRNFKKNAGVKRNAKNGLRLGTRSRRA